MCYNTTKVMTMTFVAIVDEILLFLGNYGFLLIILFGILHPLTENPWSFFTMSLSITLLGPILGYSLLLASNIVGILLLYIIVETINKRSDFFFEKKKVSKSVIDWLHNTPVWKHVIVIGMPMVPTYPIKVGLAFSKIGFKKYSTTLLLSYLYLYIIYTFAYYGLLSFLTEKIHTFVGVILIVLFIVIVYFGKNIREKLLKT